MDRFECHSDEPHTFVEECGIELFVDVSFVAYETERNGIVVNTPLLDFII